MKNRLDNIEHILNDDSVLADWFSPVLQALEKVRYHERIFNTLSVPLFLLLAGLRNLQAHSTLREQVQSLFHLDWQAEQVPLARSTWSDALASKKRRDITRSVLFHLTQIAQTELTDRYSDYSRLANRPILAIDASYQKESARYKPEYPQKNDSDKEKADKDNPKGHMLMTLYDMRTAVPMDVITETRSRGEMRVIKEAADLWTQFKNALFVVDRAFIDVRYWDERKKKYGITNITRWKSVFQPNILERLPVAYIACNEGVISDTLITLKASGACHGNPPCWRKIELRNDENEICTYLTNDLTLEPGEVAFLYHRRWDEEKYFDDMKNALGNTRAWAKKDVSIEHQALLSAMTYILTRLFIQAKQQAFELPDVSCSQQKKHKAKQHRYQKTGGLKVRAAWRNLSRIPMQIWRFLKNCYLEKSRPELYQRQLRRILVGYL